MFEELGRIVDDLAVPPIGDAIVELTSIRDKLDAHIAGAVAQYEAEGQHEVDGASSMAAWLADRCRMTGGQAGKAAKRARLTAQLPLTYERGRTAPCQSVRSTPWWGTSAGRRSRCSVRAKPTWSRRWWSCPLRTLPW